MKLTLLVKNTNDLSGSSQSSIEFSEEGGILGSQEGCAWQLQSIDQSVAAQHVAFCYHDGHFCLSRLSDDGVFVNGSSSSVELGSRTALTNGDYVQVGSLNISVIIGNEHDMETDDGYAKTAHIENMVRGELDDQDNPNYSHFVGNWPTEEDVEHFALKPKDKNIDPLEAFPVNNAHLQSEHNPLEAMDRLSVGKKDHTEMMDDIQVDLNERDKKIMASLPDATETGASSLSFSKNHTDAYSSDFVSEHYRTDKDVHSEQQIDHVVLRPLFRAMGVDTEDLSLEEHYETLMNVGEALKEALHELTNIYKKRQGRAHRFPLAQIALQPIEDNPIRLLESTNEVIRALFVTPSPVHLSGPEAVKESLSHLHKHQNATEEAIDHGLASLLDAFDPDNLEKRFKKYTKNQHIREEDKDAWAWKMYKLYHQEVRAQQQKGLQMLFWDVFGQAYNRHMRGEVKNG